MKKSALFAIVVFCFLFSPGTRASENAYSSVIDDLPLTAFMTEQTDDALTFDTSQGRIVETSVFTKEPEAQILNFYAQSLPALGWTTADQLVYIRDNEKLTLRIDPAQGGHLVHFTLTPLKGN